MGYLSSYRERNASAVGKARAPFYEMVRKYLPSDAAARVVDLGAGHGAFFEQLELAQRFPNALALDGNPDTVELLRSKGFQATHYRVPERLPLEDASVALLHCSHLVEHLTPEDLYQLMKEWDRVIASGGHLVISTPLLSENFYNDMSHLKPYPWPVFENYLGVQGGGQRSRRVDVRGQWQRAELALRREVAPLADMQLGATTLAVDFALRAAVKALHLLGVRRYPVNGYTLVLRKAA